MGHIETGYDYNLSIQEAGITPYGQELPPSLLPVHERLITDPAASKDVPGTYEGILLSDTPCYVVVDDEKYGVSAGTMFSLPPCTFEDAPVQMMQLASIGCQMTRIDTGEGVIRHNVVWADDVNFSMSTDENGKVAKATFIQLIEGFCPDQGTPNPNIPYRSKQYRVDDSGWHLEVVPGHLTRTGGDETLRAISAEYYPEIGRIGYHTVELRNLGFALKDYYSIKARNEKMVDVSSGPTNLLALRWKNGTVHLVGSNDPEFFTGVPVDIAAD